MKRSKTDRAEIVEYVPQTTTEPEQEIDCLENVPQSQSNTSVADPRIESRISGQLQSIVQVKESAESSWKEITSVSTVSKNGAGFYLSRPCAVGRLVTIVIPMPQELRAYDHFEKLYPVLGLVQYCNEGLVNNVKCYHVGVAFIGKQVPASFKENPLQNYRITGMSQTGLWSITEMDSEFKTRRHPRFWVEIDVSITILHNERKEIYRDQAVTQNIGKSGASVKSSLDANVNDKVKFAYKELDFYTVAVVRARKEIEGQTPTLHLEFLDNEFPIEKLRTVRREAAAAKTQDNGQQKAFTQARPDAKPAAVEYEQY